MTTHAVQPLPPPTTRRVPVKVAQATGMFWVIKLLTTGMGESASDFLSEKNLLLAGLVGVLGLVVTLVLQFRADRYRPPVYWSVVAMIAVFGTMAADGLGQGLGLPLPVTTAVYAVAVAACLGSWHAVEGTLSVHEVTTRRREAFYWATVLCTFALGTALGDLTAFYLGLGLLPSAVLFAVAIVPWVLWRFAGLNSVAAFWDAYVLTRPLGASLADWAGKRDGLGLGDGTVTLLVLFAVVALVARLQWSERRDGAGAGHERAAAHPRRRPDVAGRSRHRR
jgi:uncharacterized membrane-anchored protein